MELALEVFAVSFFLIAGGAIVFTSVTAVVQFIRDIVRGQICGEDVLYTLAAIAVLPMGLSLLYIAIMGIAAWL